VKGLSVRRRLIGALLAVSLLLIFAGVLSACGSSAATSAGDQAAATGDDGKPAPAFSGVTLDGKTLTLDQFRGRPLFLIYMTST
jgi:cytochrome oxidase Cu insertion factor (SCO1/SenC/PrrC family)